jgi:hypothetical protein
MAEDTLPLAHERESLYPVPVRTEWKLLARYRIHSPEMRIPEIAERIGFNHQSIRHWLRNMEYQRYENFLLGATLGEPTYVGPRPVGEVRERFGEFTGEMQDRLYDIISTTKNERLEHRAVMDWLAIAGLAPANAQPKGQFNIIMTPEAMGEFLSRAAEAGLIAAPMKMIEG